MLRPVKIKQYLSVMRTRGFEDTQVLEGTGLDASRLDDPACVVDLLQCRRVVSNMIHLTGDQGIGLQIGRQANLDDYGIIAHAMASSQTLREAVGYWVQYSNLAGMLIRLTQFDEEPMWTVMFAETEPLGFVYHFAVEEILVMGIKIAGVLAGQSLRVHEISLDYPAPLHAASYREYFDCPVRFNAERSSIRVESPQLDTPLPGKNEELNVIVRRHCAQVMRQLSGPSPFIGRVRSVLLASGGEWPSLSDTAANLRMSPRTLRRHLQNEGSTYQTVVDEFRYDLAREYLRSDELATKQVGGLLGFRDTNAFRRAFKTWSGRTIQGFRDDMQHPPEHLRHQAVNQESPR